MTDIIRFQLYCNDMNDSIIFILNKENNILSISHFTKCDNINSKLMLQLIINFSKLIRIKKIELIDGSNLELGSCFINLRMYYILLYGMSWYNQFHLVSQNYSNELITNNRYRLYSFNDFLNTSIENKKNKEIHDNYVNIEETFNYLNLTALNSLSNQHPLIITKKNKHILYLLNNIIPDYTFPSYIYLDIKKENSKDIYIAEIKYSIDTFKKLVNEHGDERIKTLALENSNKLIIKTNDEILQNIKSLFLNFIDEFNQEKQKLTEDEINNILEKLRTIFSDNPPSTFEITDTTPIMNIVRIIYILKLIDCENYKAKLLYSITDIATFVFLYDINLSYTL